MSSSAIPTVPRYSRALTNSWSLQLVYLKCATASELHSIAFTNCLALMICTYLNHNFDHKDTHPSSWSTASPHHWISDTTSICNVPDCKGKSCTIVVWEVSDRHAVQTHHHHKPVVPVHSRTQSVGQCCASWTLIGEMSDNLAANLHMYYGGLACAETSVCTRDGWLVRHTSQVWDKILIRLEIDIGVCMSCIK
jgi:hypothetical protein